MGATARPFGRALELARTMLNFLFNPNGRVSRGGFWMGLLLPQIVAAVAAAAIDTVMVTQAIAEGGAPTPGLVSTLVTLFYLWPNIAVPVKRFHDRGMSGWWVLWFGLLMVGCIIFAVVSLVGAGGGLQAAYLAAEQGVQPALDPASGAGVGMAIIGIVGAAVVGLVQFVILYLLGGQPGDNKFGPDPRDGRGGRAVSTVTSASDWADRLDREKLNAAASADRKAAAPAASASGARQVSWPSSAGPRASFGRRGA